MNQCYSTYSLKGSALRNIRIWGNPRSSLHWDSSKWHPSFFRLAQEAGEKSWDVLIYNKKTVVLLSDLTQLILIIFEVCRLLQIIPAKSSESRILSLVAI